MRLLPFLCLGALTALFLTAGCETASHAPPPPKSTIRLVLTPDDRSVLRTLVVNAALEVVLPAPEQGPEYTWEILTNNIRVLQQTRELAPLPGSSSGQFIATFQAIYPGRSTIRFAAVKKGQAESTPEDIFQIAVGVKVE